ncbi:MAG: single-stranded-DNA-specific exonuclease RecJ [Oscillospiraceae bacterium]|nr:single-stranded-DNA-specific exonuclease RecJ [Oscillospiraceae bacterium]
MRLIENHWIGPPDPGETAGKLSVAERVLLARGFSKAEERQAFLSESEPDFHDPFLLPDMEPACAAIKEAVRAGQKILIYGDYDADGITATSILYLHLKKIGARVEYMIPDRVTEGYGISDTLFDDIFSRSPDLMVTVDCGIANIDEIDRLTAKGIDVIVTDHHEVKDVLPGALAVVSAKRADSEYPFPHLCGAGVALKLVQALCAGDQPDLWKDYLDLAAIATIADVVPLLGENRSIVKQGLSMLEKSRRPGIRALAELVSRNGEALTSVSISFQLVPKINAAGRMGDASRAVELMLSEDPGEAGRIACELVEENTRRQEVEATMLEEALRQVDDMMKGSDWTFNSPLIVRGVDWHPGIVGILASRLVQRYRRSAIVFTEQSGQEGILKASARASNGYNILEAIDYAGEHVDQFGGHRKAAGITVRAEKYDDFCAAIREYADRICPESGEASIQIDAELSVSELTLDSCRILQALQPYGEENKEPLFVLHGLRIFKSALCGQDKHLKLTLQTNSCAKTDAEQELEAIAFGFGEKAAIFSPGRIVDIVFSLRVNTWADKENLSLNVADIRFSRTGNLLEDAPDVAEKLYINGLPLRQIAMIAKHTEAELLPTKADVKNVYLFLKNHCSEDVCEFDAHLMASFVNAEYGSDLHAFSFLRIIDVFEEAGLLSIVYRKAVRVCFHLLFVDGKVKLENTETFRKIFDRENK